MAASTLASSNSTFLAVEDNPAPRLREASFSSYLGTTEDSFSLRLSGEFLSRPASGGKEETAAQDDDLDVFGAEKYFGVAMDGVDVVAAAPEQPRKSCSAKEANSARRKPRSGTPSTCSEASCRSWSALLRDDNKAPAATSSRKPAPRSAGGKNLLNVFRCSCSGDASVAVEEGAKGGGGGNPAGWRVEPGQIRPEFWCGEEAKREECLNFRPALYPLAAGNLVVTGKTFNEKRKGRVSSAVVSGASFMGKEPGFGPRRSMAMMTPIGGGAAVEGDDDVCSDTSSDLFEIDSVSTGTAQLGIAGSMSASTTCSAPSEASIEWSVVTASAANFSIASDGELSPPGPEKVHRHQLPGAGMLLGCGSGKAVSISSNTHKLPEMMEAAERPRHNRPMPVTPVLRYHSEFPGSMGFRQAQAGRVSVARRIPQSIPAHTTYLW